VICGNTGWERRAVPAKQKNNSSNEKTKSQKYTNTTKQENQIINTLIMGVCTIGSEVWNKDGYGRR